MEAATCTTEVRQLTAEELKLANSVLLNAYVDDPFFRAVLPSAEYEQRLRAALREELQELWQRQQPLLGVFLGDSLIAVACLLNEHYPLGLTRFWNWRLKMALGSGWKPARQWMAREDALLDNYNLHNNWLLQFIAVAPAYQRKGFGDLMLRAIVQHSQQCQINGIATLVYRPELMTWFGNHQFRVLVEINEADVVATICTFSSTGD
ncbi:GNAT family N-acetyltransferase [Ferrimonas lipolytica]|uniref:GNAT family N-acetyltransferase n=1 Tax=Ferrimonas lipolytica TaxID=2724191 RepID=A0A6H1UGF5_9GAMM|nr:GNAT family N-acetyltransferase [Ferrimonas lipolytica]QIZ77403.1 GNAT family N-acetyltransferase [Ferrimonas lipolytica]